MNEILPQSHHTRERASSSEKTTRLECPQCESAISRDNHYCAKCGVHLIVCYGCKSPNVGHAQFCHVCGQPMILSSAPNEITRIFAGEARDFDILDQAALAIVKLHKIIESIERLELAHKIEHSQTGSIAGEHHSKSLWR